MPLIRFVKPAVFIACASSLPFVSSAVAFIGTSPASENFTAVKPTSASTIRVITFTSHTSAAAEVATIMAHKFVAVMSPLDRFIKVVEHY